MSMKSTTTVIELLNKIANKKEVPKKIRYDNTIFNLVINDFGSIYCRNEYGEDLYDSYNIYKILNDEVEVIEEPINEPSQTLTNLNCTHIDLIDPCEIADIRKEDIIEDIQTLQTWINKIIKEINKKKEGK